MKIAKVVGVQELSASEKYDPWLTEPAQRARAENLLRLHPKITEAETAEICHFLTKGRILDVGLVEGSDEFRAKVAAFRIENRRHFRKKTHEVLIAAALLAAAFSALLWYFAI